MSYYAHAHGCVDLNRPKCMSDMQEIMNDLQIEDVFDDAWYDEDQSILHLNCTPSNYHEDDVKEILTRLSDILYVRDGSMVEYTGEDDAHWCFRYNDYSGTWEELYGRIVYE